MNLPTVPLSLVLGVSCVALMLTIFVAHRLGSKSTSPRAEKVPNAEAALFGLAALMIGFTFALALSRFEDRRDAMIAEANAIGTTGLRAQFFDAPTADAIRDLLIDYVDLRLGLVREDVTIPQVMADMDKSSAIQLRLWQIAQERAAAQPSMVPTGLFVESLNEMIDLQTVRLAEGLYRVPAGVLLTLYGLVFGACIVSAYTAGLVKTRFIMPVYLLGTASILMIYLIQDLDRPSSGILSVSQLPMQATRAMLLALP